MPKDEFDVEDPFELNGVAMLTHEDTTGEMAECFIEEFMRMGHGHKQILALFRNPHYLGPHMVLEKHGEPFVRDLIVEIFARWGRRVVWSHSTDKSPTPGCSPSEGVGDSVSTSVPLTDPLSPGGGLVEDNVPTDPMGAPIPNLNV